MIGYYISGMPPTSTLPCIVVSSTSTADTTANECWVPLYALPNANAEALRIQAHAEEMRRRNLSYLWQPWSFKARRGAGAPLSVRFIPCWSARRYGSRTGRPPRVARAKRHCAAPRACRQIVQGARSVRALRN